MRAFQTLFQLNTFRTFSNMTAQQPADACSQTGPTPDLTNSPPTPYNIRTLTHTTKHSITIKIISYYSLPSSFPPSLCTGNLKTRGCVRTAKRGSGNAVSKMASGRALQRSARGRSFASYAHARAQARPRGYKRNINHYFPYKRSDYAYQLICFLPVLYKHVLGGMQPVTS